MEIISLIQMFLVFWLGAIPNIAENPFMGYNQPIHINLNENDADCKIDILNIRNETIINNVPMDNIGDGNYTITMELSKNQKHFAAVVCYTHNSVTGKIIDIPIVKGAGKFE